MAKFHCLVYILMMVLIGYVTGEDGPIVTIPQGSVQGAFRTSYGGREYTAFEGIPYGKPPIDDLRFAEPQPAEKWHGVLIANHTYRCMCFVAIPFMYGIKGTEDCLYMYVYVPLKEIHGNESLDVIVHIHGGAFMIGSPLDMAGPVYIMDKDVVFVSFNYRLAILGFLSTEDDIVPGNNGLKDQVLALQWIRDNIEYFGGNPESVTITGLSAGGASVHLHYMSPLSKAIWVTSNVRDEGIYPTAFFVATDKLAEMDSRWNELMPFMLDIQDTVDEELKKDVVTKVRKHYLDDEPVSEDNEYALVRMFSDRHFFIDGEKAARLHANVSNSSVYYYFFTYVLQQPFIVPGFRKGVSHCDDGRLLFKMFGTPKRLEADDEKMVQLFTEFITSYAKTNNQVRSSITKWDSFSTKWPSLWLCSASATVSESMDWKEGFHRFKILDIKPRFGDIEWLPIDPTSKLMNVLRINRPDDISMEEFEKIGAKDLWDSFLIKENDKITNLL
nr:esterase FE4-like [Leptinotarsa decemlineata]